MAYKKRKGLKVERKTGSKPDRMADLVREFITRAGGPVEFNVIFNYFNLKSEREYVRQELGFRIRPEFMLRSIERRGTDMATMFDGETKLVTLIRWGFGKIPRRAADVREREKQQSQARVLPMKGYKVHIG